MKTIIVTGSNSGIGKEAALNLAKLGHRILMLCRDSEKSKQAQKKIVAQTGNENVFLIPVDLSFERSNLPFDFDSTLAEIQKSLISHNLVHPVILSGREHLSGTVLGACLFWHPSQQPE